MSRSHDCASDTPVTTTFLKRPSVTECLEPACYWQRYAENVTSQALSDLRALALHHAKTRVHQVVIRLAQEVTLTPAGQPAASGAMAVTGVRGNQGEARSA